MLDEISQLEKIEFKPMVRGYIEGVSAVHNVFRSVIDPKRKTWIAKLAAAKARFTRCFPDEHTIALAVLPVDKDGLQAGEPAYVAGPMVAYLDHTQSKYATMVNFAKRKVDF